MTPQQLRASILQLAVQGKLAAQRPEEGTGGELYAQIQQEKQKLIAAGKLKKEKPLLEITEDEIPFEIPESWKWCRLGLISSYAQSKEKVLTKDVSPNIWSLDLEDIEKTTGRIVQKITVGERQSKGDRVRFYKGQILYSKLRPYLLKILIADDDGITTSEMVPFQIYGPVEQKYFMWYLKSPFVDSTVNQSTYGVKMPRVGTETMINLLVPLPPLAEQKRIVARLQELLPLCGRLSQMNA